MWDIQVLATLLWSPTVWSSSFLIDGTDWTLTVSRASEGDVVRDFRWIILWRRSWNSKTSQKHQHAKVQSHVYKNHEILWRAGWKCQREPSLLLTFIGEKKCKLREVKWLFQNDTDVQRTIWCYNQIFLLRNDVASLPLNTRIDGCFFGWAPPETLAPCLETNGYPDNTVFKQNNHSHFAQMPVLRERHGDRHCLRDQPVSVTHPVSHRGTLLLQETASMPLNYLNSHFLCWMHASVY